ncbi:WXG100 family type VII secretion target [Saccharomonospora sp. NPDC006951]
MSKTWEETQALLDDPYVSAQTKEALLFAYRQSGGQDSAATEYYDKYNIDDAYYGYPNAGYHGYGLVDVDAVYDQAESEAETEGYRDRQVTDRISDNQSELDNAMAPGSGSGAITTSDELFDLAEPALEVFESFVPIDEEAPSESRHIDGPLSYDDIKTAFDEQRGIDFQKFLDEAQRLRDAHDTLQGLHSTTESNLNTLYQEWTGDGANASYQKYSEDIAPNVGDLLEALEGSAEVIEAAVQAVYEACKAKADEVIDMYQSTVGAAIPGTASKVMTLARGDFESQDEVLEVAAWVDAETGSDLEATIRADDCDLNDENKQMTINQCKIWVQDSWNPDLYDNLYERFTAICEDTKEAVDQAWGDLNGFLKDYENKFPEESGDSSVPSPETPQPEDGGAGPSGDGGGTGGGGGSPGGGSAPPAPEPEDEATGATEPGTNPVTGDELEVDPETGKPYPIDPETGEAIKDLGDDRDTLTVEKGDNTFEMTEPGEDGKMEVSVDDGTGEPKEYQLDFGTGEDGASDDFGPEGSGEEGEEQVYRPGPDGKIRIEDGDLTITAEQPEGPQGPTRVTVDDGTPPPTTYTLGENKNEPGHGPGSQLPRETIRTMPGDPVSVGAQGESGDGDPGDGSDFAAPPADDGMPSVDGGELPGPRVDGDHDGIHAEVSEEHGDTDVRATVQQTALSASVEPQSAQAGIAVAPGGMGETPPAAQGGTGGGVGGAGGMGMMGGMGPMGAGAGNQSGDQDRTTSPYRIDGGIFGNTVGGNRISGSLYDEGERSIRYDR